MCLPWKHKWSKWELKSAKAVVLDPWKNIVIPNSETVIVIQERRCETCGKYEREGLP